MNHAPEICMTVAVILFVVFLTLHRRPISPQLSPEPPVSGPQTPTSQQPGRLR